VLGALARTADLDAVADTVPTRTPWRKGGLALGRGDPVTASRIFGRIGARPFEAEARLLAGRDGRDGDLPGAIEFFREVGATGYLREAEAVSATSRSA
jgi:hypothetical protein